MQKPKENCVKEQKTAPRSTVLKAKRLFVKRDSFSVHSVPEIDGIRREKLTWKSWKSAMSPRRTRRGTIVPEINLSTEKKGKKSVASPKEKSRPPPKKRNTRAAKPKATSDSEDNQSRNVSKKSSRKRPAKSEADSLMTEDESISESPKRERPSSRLENSLISEEESTPRRKPASRALARVDTTPKSSPIFVPLTPHRSKKTPRRSPENFGSPKRHSDISLGLSKTPRKLEIDGTPPSSEDSLPVKKQEATRATKSSSSPSKATKSPRPKKSPKREVAKKSTKRAAAKSKKSPSPKKAKEEPSPRMNQTVSASTKKVTPKPRRSVPASKVKKSPAKARGSPAKRGSSSVSRVAVVMLEKMGDSRKSKKSTPMKTPSSSPNRPKSVAKRRIPLTNSGTPLRPVPTQKPRSSLKKIILEKQAKIASPSELRALQDSSGFIASTPREKSRRTLNLSDSPIVKKNLSSPINLKSPSPIKKKSPSPIKKKSPSPIKKKSPSPIKVKSPSPIKRKAVSSIDKKSPSPTKKKVVSPVAKKSPISIKVTSPSPNKKKVVSSVNKKSPSPIKKKIVSPVKKKSPITFKINTPSPMKKKVVSPTKKKIVSPTKKKVVSPVKKKSLVTIKLKSPSPIKKKVSSPGKKNSSINIKFKSPSPNKKKVASPVKKNSSITSKSKSPSPSKKKIVSPVKKESPIWMKVKSPSPIKKKRAVSPVKKNSKIWIKVKSPSPIKKKRAVSPVKNKSPVPVKVQSQSPSKKIAVSPIAKKKSVSPLKRKISLSPFTRKNPSSPRIQKSFVGIADESIPAMSDTSLINMSDLFDSDVSLKEDEKKNKDGTYELLEPKTPTLQAKKSRKRKSVDAHLSGTETEAKKVCKVRFAESDVVSNTSVAKLRSGTPGHKLSLKRLSEVRSKSRSPQRLSKGGLSESTRRRSSSVSVIEGTPRTPSNKRRNNSVATSTLKSDSKAQLASVNRLSRPRVSAAPVEKKPESKTPVARKIPNFAGIHQKNFKKMESIVDGKKRLEERHVALVHPIVTSATKSMPEVTLRKRLEPTKAVATTEGANGAYTRFGFKVRRNEAAQSIAKKQPIMTSEKKKKARRDILKGVRTNRRFELQMKSRKSAGGSH
ncbi:serine/arginine repetitive matrix protein 1-like [Belonocnema kinseyi]|uniref:serine/arginine repetitive matrix protein 1-like n=1 Tax=Belonocnema kinseyi TaxID=2817044 RepID=UPI00143D9307|nr:serine/arginine repetitive matrix protein 1-like [Belonocnema kinseyi]